MKSNLLVRNILTSQAGFAVSAITALFLSPLVVHALGDARYGIWALLMSFTGHYGLLSLGVRGALTRYIAESKAKNDDHMLRAFTDTALGLLLFSAIVALLFSLLLAPFLPKLFNIPSQLSIETQYSFLLIAATVSVTFLDSLLQSSLIGIQRMEWLNLNGILGTLARAALTIYVLRQNGGMKELALITLIVTIAASLGDLAIYRANFKNLPLQVRAFSFKILRTLLAFGLKSTTSSVGMILIYQCDLLVLGICADPVTLGHYSLAGSLIAYLNSFVNALSYAFAPYATEQFALTGLDGLRTFFVKAANKMYALAAIIVACSLVFSKPFFALWIGPEYSHIHIILSVLMISQFPAIGARIGSAVLIGRAQIGPLAAASVLEGCANIILSLILVHRFGALGVAIGTAVPMFICSGIWLPHYVVRILHIPKKDFFYKILLPALLIFLCTLALGCLINILLVPGNWFMLIFAIMATVLIALGLTLLSDKLPTRMNALLWRPRSLL
jgi:O-antigen/teichoic acid export membrane protein